MFLVHLSSAERVSKTKLIFVGLSVWMNTSALPESLHDDRARLQALVVEYARRIDEQAHRIEQLEHSLIRLRRWQFGTKSERIPEEQLIFAFYGELESPNEKMLTEDEKPTRSLSEGLSRACRAIPSELPVRTIVKDLPEADQNCPECGKERIHFGFEDSRRLEYIPASFFVDLRRLKKYVCKPCQEHVATASAPEPMGPIEGGLPGPGPLAKVIVAKFCDHLPLYRQSRIYERHGVRIARSTLCDWVGQGMELLGPIVEATTADILSSEIIQTDDTVVRLLAPGRGRTVQARLWGYLSHGPKRQVVYHFTPTREQKWPLEFLKNYKGYVQCDAYPGYNKLFYAGSGRHELGCMAHARRYFFEAKGEDSERAMAALRFIAQLYRVEAQARDMEPNERLALRREGSRPIAQEFKGWLDRESLRVLPKSLLGQAIRYALGQWPVLVRYIDVGEASIDNSGIERPLRGVAVGRKNYLFMGREDGGRWAATAYSLIESCKLNGVEPWAYLKDVFMRVWTHPQSRIAELMPRLWKPPPDST